MLRVNYFILPIFTILLSACGSTPTVTYTPEGEKYFASNDKKYSNVRVAVASTNEAKAIKSGYMSNEKIKEYIEANMLSRLKDNNNISNDGAEIKISFKIDRTYSWGGSSMQIFGYIASIAIEKEGKVLAEYKDYGQIQDNSISGNFKSVFGKNKPSSEGKYINTAINSMFGKLPK